MFACGLIGAVAEAIPAPVDDNLSLPVLSGALLHWCIPAEWWAPPPPILTG